MRHGYYRLALARQLRTLTVDHLQLSEQLIEAVRIKYEVGRAEQRELLRLELLRGQRDVGVIGRSDMQCVGRHIVDELDPREFAAQHHRVAHVEVGRLTADTRAVHAVGGVDAPQIIRAR